jgi:DNA-binding NarL/FixJ family response regulator
MLTRTEPTKPLSILIADDDQRFRIGLRTLLDFYREQTKRFAVVGEASRVDTALSLVAQKHPDLLLLDLELYGGSGMAVLQQLRDQQEKVKPLVISAHQEDHWIYRAMQAGAVGYIFKAQLSKQLWDAITTVMQGKVYLPAEAATGFFRQFQEARSDLPLQSEQDYQLSNREKEVLLWLVRGESNEKIADQLHITTATVKAHLTNVFQKLKVTSRTQAIIKALSTGLVQT